MPKIRNASPFFSFQWFTAFTVYLLFLTQSISITSLYSFIDFLFELPCVFSDWLLKIVLADDSNGMIFDLLFVLL